MQEERMMVLKMVSEGKISAEEGVQLIKALNNDSTEKIKRVAKDVGNKIGEIAKVAEPKVKKATKAAVTKTGEVVDEIGKNIKDIINNKCKAQNDDCGCGCEDYEYADFVDEDMDYESVDESDEVTEDDIVKDVVIKPVDKK